MLDWLKDKAGRACRWSKTVLAARLLHVGAGIVTVHDFVLPYAMGQDWTPITQDLPPYALPVAMVALGAIFEALRAVTTQPLIDKKPEESDAGVS